MEIKKIPKNPQIFLCEICDYNTRNKKDYLKHCLTDKHKCRVNGNEKIPKKSPNYFCLCGKKYVTNNGLWEHLKNCKLNNTNDNIQNINDNINDNISEKSEDNQNITLSELFNEDEDDNNQLDNLTSIIFELVKQNKDFQKMLIEQNNQILELSKNVGSNNNNINSYNSNNTFNLQLFLNEKCKDALTINEFIDSLKITMDDVERFGTHGFIEGISKIFLKNLKMLDICKRPFHCSDLKREILYVKEENTWKKDDENKEVMKKTINKIAFKNFLRIQDWREENPEYKDPESKVNDKYQKIMFEAMGGYTKEEDEKNFAKIIRNISKEITIDRKL